MSLEKKVNVDRIEILETGIVQIRTKTAIIENGEQISESLHRHLIAPGEDYSAEDARVQAVCAAVHTPEVIAAYQAMLEANRVEAVSEAG